MMVQQKENFIIKDITTYTPAEVVEDINKCEQEYQDLVVHQRETLLKCKNVIEGLQDVIGSARRDIGRANGKFNKKNF